MLNSSEQTPVLGRGFTNPQYYILVDTTPRDLDMTTENNTTEMPYTEEQLQNTLVAKGFTAFTYVSDLMQRYPMDLNAIREGRIFSDENTSAKVRRKLIKGQPNQNSIFEAYRTRDNQNVVHSTVEISNDGFTPSMLAAALAAKLMLDRDNGYTRLAYQFIQVASALLQEGDKAERAEATKLNPTNDPTLEKYYDVLKSIHSRAYAITAISDLLKIVAGENPNAASLADDMEYIRNIDDEVTGEGSRAEAQDALNMFLAGTVNLGFSQTFKDIIVMSDEVKENVGEAAMMELSGEEQK